MTPSVLLGAAEQGLCHAGLRASTSLIDVLLLIGTIHDAHLRAGLMIMCLCLGKLCPNDAAGQLMMLCCCLCYGRASCDALLAWDGGGCMIEGTVLLC